MHETYLIDEKKRKITQEAKKSLVSPKTKQYWKKDFSTLVDGGQYLVKDANIFNYDYIHPITISISISNNFSYFT